jgi:hypothetical protein
MEVKRVEEGNTLVNMMGLRPRWIIMKDLIDGDNAGEARLASEYSSRSRRVRRVEQPRWPHVWSLPPPQHIVLKLHLVAEIDFS